VKRIFREISDVVNIILMSMVVVFSILQYFVGDGRLPAWLVAALAFCLLLEAIGSMIRKLDNDEEKST
jgi:hypothetical protein